jgi:hypothetical protein
VSTVFLSPAAFQDLVRYAWDEALDRVLVARIRHQREVGYTEEEV